MLDRAHYDQAQLNISMYLRVLLNMTLSNLYSSVAVIGFGVKSV